MTLRSLAAALGIAAVLGLSGEAVAQDKGAEKAPARARSAKGKVVPARAKAKAQEKAESDDKSADKGESESEDKDKDKKEKPKLEKATFGGGCFWCFEAVFERIPGVKSVVSGYAGGNVPRPTYEMVQTGLTGHAEVVQITFDPEKVSFEDLLQVFWQFHDPTSLNRQGPDEGTEYRSIILYHDEDQKKAALKSYEELTAARAFARPIVTQLVPLKKFYPAERYHQDYFRRHPGDEYCQMNIVPKVEKLRVKLKHKAAEAHKEAEAGGDSR